MAGAAELVPDPITDPTVIRHSSFVFSSSKNSKIQKKENKIFKNKISKIRSRDGVFSWSAIRNGQFFYWNFNWNFDQNLRTWLRNPIVAPNSLRNPIWGPSSSWSGQFLWKWLRNPTEAPNSNTETANFESNFNQNLRKWLRNPIVAPNSNNLTNN